MADVWQGTLALMILRTLDTIGAMHGYGIARRIEQTSGGMLSLNYGTLYPALLKLEQEGAIAGEWGTSEHNRKARFYKITKTGRKLLSQETKHWEQATAVLERFLSPRRIPHETPSRRARSASGVPLARRSVDPAPSTPSSRATSSCTSTTTSAPA